VSIKKDHVEIAPDLTEEQLAWIAETERELADLERRVAAGEKIDFSGWTSENWIAKTRGYAPVLDPHTIDCDAKIDGKETRGILCDVCDEVIQPEQLELEKQLAALEFEIRYESDRLEMDEIAKQRDAVRRRLKKLKCHA